jgi:chemotaxis protein MotB
MKIIRIERIKEPADANKAPIWMVGFTDLVTILLAFFILLFATAQPRKATWDVATESLRSSFGGKQNIKDLRGDAGAVDAENTWQSVNEDPGLNLDYLHSLIKKYIKADETLSSLVVWKDQETVVISFAGDLNFAPGKTELSSKGLMILNKLTPLLDTLPNQLEMVGHSDQTAIKNDTVFNSNWQLSLARANSVAKAVTAAGYRQDIAIRGRGTNDAELLPRNIPEDVRNSQARRVDLRLHMVHP